MTKYDVQQKFLKDVHDILNTVNLQMGMIVNENNIHEETVDGVEVYKVYGEAIFHVDMMGMYRKNKETIREAVKTVFGENYSHFSSE